MANSTTTPRDNIVRALRFYTSMNNYPIGGSAVSFDFFQGDLMYWDSSAAYIKPLDSDANAAYLVGVALRSAYLAPYASMQLSGGPAMVKNYFDSGLVGFGCVASFFSTSGETYADGQSVYWSATQTIQKAAGSHSLGVVKLAPGQSAISGGSTVLVPVLVIPQIPVQSL